MRATAGNAVGRDPANAGDPVNTRRPAAGLSGSWPFILVATNVIYRDQVMKPRTTYMRAHNLSECHCDGLLGVRSSNAENAN